MLPPGIYKQVINTALNRELSEIPDARKSVAPIDKAEASKVLAQYLADVVQKGLENVLDNGGDISAQIELANRIVTIIQNPTQEADFASLNVDQRAEQLLALLQEQDPRLAVGKIAADLSRPETSIAQSSLFTGAIHEPQMYTELKKEIVSADRIDMLVSFISPTGQRYIHHRERGSKVLLFVREFKADRITGGAEAYTFLGTANYVKHEGSRPMNITWKLDRPIPAKFLKKTNKLVVG